MVAMMLFVTAVMGSESVASGASSAQAVGEVVVVQAEAVGRELANGASSTPFSLRLPDGAACPGDTQNDQWKVQTFLVPEGDDPGKLDYSFVGPTGPRQYGLYELSTSPYVNEILLPNESPGEPGIIPPIPPLTFSVFPPGELSGTYRIGIACDHFDEDGRRFWDTKITFTSESRDEPGGFLWSIPGAVPEPTEGGSKSTRGLIFGIAAIAAIATIITAIRRRKSATQEITAKEYS